MLELLSENDSLLDLGCGNRSPISLLNARINIGVDIEKLIAARNQNQVVVQADATKLPFRDQSFTYLVANHSLEHVLDLDECLLQIRRILHAEATAYVAVPLSTTLSDRLYKFIYRGGGHVQAFDSLEGVIEKVASRLAMPCLRVSRIDSGYTFLISPHIKKLGKKRRCLLFWLNPSVLSFVVFLFSVVDKYLRSDLLLYGYELYFSSKHQVIADRGPCFTCCGCGSIHLESYLEATGTLRFWLKCVKIFTCPSCGHKNYIHR